MFRLSVMIKMYFKKKCDASNVNKTFLIIFESQIEPYVLENISYIYFLKIKAIKLVGLSNLCHFNLLLKNFMINFYKKK